MREGMDPRPGNENKAIGLSSHSTAMNLMIQCSGDGWSQGSVLAKSRNSSRMHCRNRALKQSFRRGRCHTVFNKSNRTARGTEYNTNAWSEFTMLNSITEWSGMNHNLE